MKRLAVPAHGVAAVTVIQLLGLQGWRSLVAMAAGASLHVVIEVTR